MAFDILIDTHIHVHIMCVHVHASFVMHRKIDVISRGCQFRVRVVQKFKNSRRALANTKPKDDEATLSNTSRTNAALPIEPIK